MKETIWYRVILKPSDVRFTVPTVSPIFEDGRPLMDAVREIVNEKIAVSDIPIINVVWYGDKWEWYTLNNRRLWVFKELERLGKITYVAMKRVEEVDIDEHPSEMYGEVGMDYSLAKSGGDVSCNSSEDEYNNNEAKNLDTKREEGSRQVEENSKSQRRRSREASISSVTSENDRSKTDWGRRDAESTTKFRELKSVVNNKLKGKREDAFNVWKEERTEFCKLYNNDESFQQYVASQFKEVPRKESTKSFDEVSAISDFSVGSQSSLTRHQRRLSWKSGMNGYGNFELYRTEFLEKLRSARKRSLRDLKPYDVNRSRFLRYHSTFVGKESDDVSLRTRSLSFSSQDDRDFETPFVRRRRNTYSAPSPVDLDDDVFEDATSGFNGLGSLSSSYSRNIKCSSSKDLDSRRLSMTLNIIEKRVTSLQVNGFLARTKAELYSIWEKRRSSYMQKRFLQDNPKAVEYKYCCGICFKEFEARVSLEQHSEELMHWGCVQCGRFFASRTSLGQHALTMGHREF